MNSEGKIITDKDGGCLIRCRVQPSASKSEVKGTFNSTLKISVAAPPVDGKANKVLRVFLAKKLKVPKSSVFLVSGESSRNKTVFCACLSSQEAEKKLI